MNLVRWLLIVGGIVGLVSVRMVEDRIFYDPFLHYFQEVGTNAVFPQFEFPKLIASHLFRFVLNLLFSLLLVHGLFQRKKWTVQATVLILLAFAITFPLYLFCVANGFEIGYLFSFYVRRFVIQPMVSMLIIPLFYYRKFLQEKPLQ